MTRVLAASEGDRVGMVGYLKVHRVLAPTYLEVSRILAPLV